MDNNRAKAVNETYAITFFSAARFVQLDKSNAA